MVSHTGGVCTGGGASRSGKAQQKKKDATAGSASKSYVGEEKLGADGLVECWWGFASSSAVFFTSVAGGAGLSSASPFLGRLGCAWRRDGPTRVHPSVLVLGLFLRGLQDLERSRSGLAVTAAPGAFPAVGGRRGCRTWNEHIRVSSTLIIPPALSNSPQ